MRCDRIVESGAYVLGALSPAERAAFEAHLAGCAACRDEVAELAGMPGLLGRLDVAVAESLLADGPRRATGPESEHGMQAVAQIGTLPGVPGGEYPADAGAQVAGGRDGAPPPLERLLAAVRRRRAARRRWSLGLATAGLAAVVALAGAIALRPATQPPPAASGSASAVAGSGDATARMVAMRPVGRPGPVTARVGLTGFAGGTRIAMDCEYTATDRDRRWTFQLYVYGRGGSAEMAGSWTAQPGVDVRAEATSRWAPADITRVELRRGDGTPLLAYTP